MLTTAETELLIRTDAKQQANSYGSIASAVRRISSCVDDR